MIDLLGKQVLHKVFGNGIIKSINDSTIVVSFDQFEKSFIFPDVFKAFLTATDEKTASIIAKLLEAPPPKPEINAPKPQDQDKKKKSKKVQRENIAFKCNYCDGGKSNEQVGFSGVCSDAIIQNNICIENRTWCRSGDSPCLHYFSGEINRKELEDQMIDAGFVCYESHMLRDWRASAGIVQKDGINKGKPMRLNKVQANSLCVLTTRYPESDENERFIFAVFLVDETFEGDYREEGFVSTQSEFKIKLSPPEAERTLYWHFHANGKNPEDPAWGHGLHRYFDDQEAVQILRDILKIKLGTKDEQLAERFLQHFCRINRVDANSVPEPNGALAR